MIYLLKNKNSYFHINSVTLSLALKQRLGANSEMGYLLLDQFFSKCLVLLDSEIWLCYGINQILLFLPSYISAAYCQQIFSAVMIYNKNKEQKHE